MGCGGISSASSSRWMRASHRRSSPFEEIDSGQPFKGSMKILCQAEVVYLGDAPQPVERQERTLDLGVTADFALVGILGCIAQRDISPSAPAGQVLRSGSDHVESLPLSLVTEGTLAIDLGNL